MKKWLSLFMMLSVVCLLAVACNETNGEIKEGTNEPARHEDTVTLEAWIISNSPSTEITFRKSIQPYLDTKPELTVNVRVLSWDTAWDDIVGAVQSGKGPDVLQLGTTWVPTIAAMNGLADLSELVSEVGGVDAYLPASWRTTMIEGESTVYAVPWFVEARALYYRKDAFQRAGVDPATAFESWDSFKSALQQVNGTEIDGKRMIALGIPGKNDWNVAHNFFPWIWGAGGDVLSGDRTAVTLADEAALTGVSYYTSLAREGLTDLVSLTKNSSEVEADFADGKSAVIIAGSWLLQDFFKPRSEGGLGGVLTHENLGVAALPAGPHGRATFVGGSNLSVFQASQHQEEAKALIAYLSSEEAQLRYAGGLGMLPARSDLIASPQLMENFGYRAFAEAVQYGKSYPSIPEWGIIENALVTHFSEIWSLVMESPSSYSQEEIQARLEAASREIDVILQSQ